MEMIRRHSDSGASGGGARSRTTGLEQSAAAVQALQDRRARSASLESSEDFQAFATTRSTKSAIRASAPVLGVSAKERLELERPLSIEQLVSMRSLVSALAQDMQAKFHAIEGKLGALERMETKLDGLRALHGEVAQLSEQLRSTSGPLPRPSLHGRLSRRPEELNEEKITRRVSNMSQAPSRLSRQSPRRGSSATSQCTVPDTPPGNEIHAPKRTPSSKSLLALNAAMHILDKNSTRGWLARRVWQFLEPSAGGPRWFVRVWQLLVLFSVAVGILQEIDLNNWEGTKVVAANVAFDLIFVLEILVRFLVCPDRNMFFHSFFNIIDMAAGPLSLLGRSASWLLDFGTYNERLSTGLHCLVPVLRQLKMLRRFAKFHLLLSAFKIAIEALPVLLFTLFIIVMIFSSAIYLVEPAWNVPNLQWAMWLTIVTMTTVGYGDAVPKSTPGHMIVTVLVICSALYMAMPIGIVGSAFNRVWEDRDRLLLMQRIRDQIRQKGYAAWDIPELFFFFDEDNDGQLSFPEFRAMMSSIQLGIGEERLVKLFYAFDVDGTGGISDTEFVRLLFPRAFCEIYGVPPKPSTYSVSTTGSHPHGRRAGVQSVNAFRRTLLPEPTLGPGRREDRFTESEDMRSAMSSEAEGMCPSPLAEAETYVRASSPFAEAPLQRAASCEAPSLNVGMSL